MADVKHGDLSIQQITDIQKSLLVSLRSRETFWDKFCSHTSIAAGMSELEWRKLNVPKLTKDQLANLAEGITPAGLSLQYVKFKTSPVDYGSWIGYTDKSKRYNFDDVVRDAKTVLGQRAFEEAEMRKGLNFIAGTCTMDLVSGTNGFLKTLLKARTYLKKNHIKPIRGNRYGCILAPEHAAQVLLDYETQITHTSEKEAIINGYIGELGGFILFENADEVMYKPAVAAAAAVGTEGQEGYVPAVAAQNAKSYVLFIGKTEYGMPVQTVSFGNSSVEVYNNELGKAVSVDANGNVVADTLHQHGSVGYKVMGFAARILADEAIIRAEFDLGSEGAWEKNVADANRSNYEAGPQTSPNA